MSSVFKTATKAVVREMGEDLIPVRNAIDGDKFKCFCVVRERKTWLGLRYDRADFALRHIIETKEGESPVDEVDSQSPDQNTKFEISEDKQSEGECTVKLKMSVTMEIKGKAQRTQMKKIKLLRNQIPEKTLMSLKKRNLKKELHPAFEAIREKRENLYLVTEAVMTEERETLTNASHFNCSILIEPLMALFKKKHDREVDIPPNWVLAYRIKQLVFPKKDTMEICFLDKTQSFPEENVGASSIGKSLTLEDTRKIKEMVQDLRSVLQDLTEKEKKDILSCLIKSFSDSPLQNLEEQIAEVLTSEELPLESPARPLLDSLFNAAGILIKERAEAIKCLLDTLMELSEEEQNFVFEVLKNKELSMLVEQLEKALEKYWNGDCSKPRDVDQESEAQFLSCFYVVLSILLELDGNPTSASP